MGAVAELNGLTEGEYLVLTLLEQGAPRPFFEIADDFVRRVAGTLPTMAQVAAVLGPGVISATARELLRVHRFPSWPMSWLDGVDVDGPELEAAGRFAANWSESGRGEVLVA